MDIVVLCGGLSAERDVSITGAAMAAAALRRLGHRVFVADLFFGCTLPSDNPKKLFTAVHSDTIANIAETAPNLDILKNQRIGNTRIGDNILTLCSAADIVFIALHGEDGEDGKIQAALDLHGIKYTGTDHLGSAIAMNKAVSKQLLTAAGINTPAGIVVGKSDTSARDVGFPCVVKPCSGGSSVGASVVNSRADYLPALELAFSYDNDVVVEQYIKGRECDVGVIAGRALPVIEIRTKSGFFDYKNKYQTGMAEEICPADLPPDITEKLQRTAERVFETLKFDVYGRMDFIVDDGGEVWCLEGNTLPGITATSLLPQEAAADGISYDELCDMIVSLSLKKYELGEKQLCNY